VAASATNQAQIIERALPRSSPTSPNRPLLVALAVVAGLIVPTGAVVAIDAMASGVYSVRDAEAALKLPVIAIIPMLARKDLAEEKGESAQTPLTYLASHMSSPYAEAFRALRRSLGDAKLVTLTSAVPEEGKSTTAISLARICGASGEKVILVDSDVRRATVNKLVGTGTTKGLVEVLTGEAIIEDVIVHDEAFGVAILPTINSTFPQTDLFSGPSFLALIEQLRASYDRIIFDTAPVLTVVDARHVASISDKTFLVLRWGTTPQRAAVNALHWLDIDGTKPDGLIMTMADKSAEQYGHIYYAYRYKNYYKSDQ
jgi:capsular exopolysaccharide synthesis family protein